MIFYWISLLFHLFKEIIKKCFSLSILSALLKKFGDMIHEKFKKTKKFSKNFIIFSSNLNHIFWPGKCWNLDFSISIKVVENWISLPKKKEINPKSIGILSSKLWPKYEIGAEDNTNSALSSIFSQNFKWGSTSNLFKLIW